MFYLVKKPFEKFVAGDQVALNPRQAKYLLMMGHIEMMPQPKIAQEDDKK